MTEAHDGPSLTRDLGPHDADGSTGEGPRILVVDADSALLGLLEEWLGGSGCRVVQERGDADPQATHFDLVIVDVPFPRQGGLALLRRIAREHPRTPILALSSTFFAGVERDGAIARALGVASVLPMPVTRDALLRTVQQLLHQ